MLSHFLPPTIWLYHGSPSRLTGVDAARRAGQEAGGRLWGGEWEEISGDGVDVLVGGGWWWLVLFSSGWWIGDVLRLRLVMQCWRARVTEIQGQEPRAKPDSPSLPVVWTMTSNVHSRCVAHTKPGANRDQHWSKLINNVRFFFSDFGSSWKKGDFWTLATWYVWERI